MCSRGSVIPLFIDQIRAGRPVTVTDPAMTRFLIKLDEAVGLVLFAFGHAEPGDLFIQKAPAATIGDLAEAVQELFGRTGAKVIGTRHGTPVAVVEGSACVEVAEASGAEAHVIAADLSDLRATVIRLGGVPRRDA